MIVRRTDLPLNRDALGRFLPWLIAFMVYLAVMALAGMLLLNQLAGRWDQGIGSTVTVQIPAAADKQQDARHMQAALKVLKDIPQVLFAEAIPESQIATLLEPWLGAIGGSGDLPLPQLIDIELKEGATLDEEAVHRKLSSIVPGVTVDSHGLWLERMVRLIRTVEILSIAVLALIALATVGTVIFTTRTGLAIHQDVIEVLHLIGARDSYVARQFATRALFLGLRGGLIGLFLALPTLWGIGFLVRSLDSSLLPDVSLQPMQWLMLAVVPAAAALIAMLTARITVVRSLAGMI